MIFLTIVLFCLLLIIASLLTHWVLLFIVSIYADLFKNLITSLCLSRLGYKRRPRKKWIWYRAYREGRTPII